MRVWIGGTAFCDMMPLTPFKRGNRKGDPGRGDFVDEIANVTNVQKTLRMARAKVRKSLREKRDTHNAKT
jgi:hypothetical protein